MAYSNKEASPRGQGLEPPVTDYVATYLAKTDTQMTGNQQGEEETSHEFRECNPDLRCPWLLFQYETILNFYNIATNQSYVEEIAHFKDKHICGSSHGWLATIDTQDSDCFLFNPFSFEKIKLPTREPKSGWCLLSSPPTDDDHESCFAVFLDRNKSSISFCRVGEMEWNEMNYTDEHIRDFTVMNEKFYFLDYKCSLFVLDFSERDGESFGIREIVENGLYPSTLLPEVTYFITSLIESRGNMFAVVISEIGQRCESTRIGAIEVFKVDFLELKWVQVESLGDLSFFITNFGSSNSMSCCATEVVGVKANSIYLVADWDETLYRYDMEERSIHRSLPCQNLDPDWVNFPIWLGCQ